METVMTLAGSDSGGGAGVQADLKTMLALGCHGTSVFTALTAQNTVGVSGVLAVPVEFIQRQFNAIVSDFRVAAVKTGMLPSVDVISCVAGLLRGGGISHFVLDPVMVATSGASLAGADVMAAMVAELFPLASVITPNIPEASALLGRVIASELDMERAAVDLLSFGSRAVVLKGGHLSGVSGGGIVDMLVLAAGSGLVRCYRQRRISTRNLHGTGCTLSAALASYLALGYGLELAFGHAQSYVHRAIVAGSGFCLGRGSGPLWHLV